MRVLLFFGEVYHFLSAVRSGMPMRVCPDPRLFTRRMIHTPRKTNSPTTTQLVKICPNIYVLRDL